MATEIDHKSLSQKTYLRLRSLIVTGKLAPGVKLPYHRLALQLGVSVTPLREALMSLVKEGLVVFLPRKGMFVNTLSQKDVEEVYEIREMLEGLAAALASQHAGAGHVATLRESCAEFESALRANDMTTCLKSDFWFHELLVQASGNGRLIEMIKIFHVQSSSIAKTGPDYMELCSEYLREHRAVIDAVARHDSDRAERLIRAHIRKGKKRLLEFEQEEQRSAT